jgi:hypothetical protein
MKRIKVMMKTAVALGLLVLGCSLAQAQATRTWISGVGNDANPCSIFSPCKTLAGAYGKTAAGGQINALDANAVGTLSIDHSITIDVSESFNGILGLAGFDGITVAAGASDVVVLRGLTLHGAGVADNGIKFVSGGRLQVENCIITGFTQRGIDYESKGTNQLIVKDTVIRENGAAGIIVQPVGAGSAQATIEHTRLEGNQNGLSVQDNANVTIRDSVLAGNSSNGVVVTASAASTEVNIEDCLMANNADTGVKASGPGAKAIVRLSGSTVTANATGLFADVGGTIDSFANNNIGGNKVDGAPNNKIPKV